MYSIRCATALQNVNNQIQPRLSTKKYGCILTFAVPCQHTKYLICPIPLIIQPYIALKTFPRVEFSLNVCMHHFDITNLDINVVLYYKRLRIRFPRSHAYQVVLCYSNNVKLYTLHLDFMMCVVCKEIITGCCGLAFHYTESLLYYVGDEIERGQTICDENLIWILWPKTSNNYPINFKNSISPVLYAYCLDENPSKEPLYNIYDKLLFKLIN